MLVIIDRWSFGGIFKMTQVSVADNKKIYDSDEIRLFERHLRTCAPSIVTCLNFQNTFVTLTHYELLTSVTPKSESSKKLGKHYMHEKAHEKMPNSMDATSIYYL